MRNVDFMLILCSVVSTVPSEDVLLLLGDFNARVGCRIRSMNYDKEQRVDGMAGDKFTWGSALIEVGPSSLGSCNQAGEDVLLWMSSYFAHAK